jgi:hypothetical protein
MRGTIAIKNKKATLSRESKERLNKGRQQWCSSNNKLKRAPM